MRFQFGVPQTDGFAPEQQAQWLALDEPSQRGFAAWALVWSLPWSALLFGAWIYALRHAHEAADIHIPIVPTLLSLPLMLVVHELLHMLVHPGAGRERDSVLGAMPSCGMLFAVYLGELSRVRLVAILLTPLLVITVVPWAACAASGRFHAYWAVLSLLNGIAAIGDVMSVWLVLRGTPAGAVLRNQGWQTWWRPG